MGGALLELVAKGSQDIFLTGKLPSEWSPVNNGWPIVVSGFFMMINSDSAIQLMQIQKLLSTVISVMIIFPVYFQLYIFHFIHYYILVFFRASVQLLTLLFLAHP